MKELENKYRDNSISSEEIERLKKQINSMTDEELATYLLDSWVHDEIETGSVDSGRLDRLKMKIDQTVKKPGRVIFLKKAVQIAAAILLPLFIFTTWYLYRENNTALSEEMVVSTGTSERASITLPDGTEVALNSESRLAYFPKSYNKSDRKISFQGEGYFQVSKNSGKPFLISSEGVNVKVLGTTFNLKVSNNSKIAELSLEIGKVLITSSKTKKEATLYKGDKAIIEQETGILTVIRKKNIENDAAWKHGQLTFNETSLTDVINDLEKNFGVSVSADKKVINDSTDLFTGSMPAKNLNEALTIIKKTYHLNSIQKGNSIILTKEK